MSPEYLLTPLVVCFAPGIGGVCTLSIALAQGMRGGFRASVGCRLATIVHMAVAVAGLAAILHSSALLFRTVKSAGVAYLMWMAWGALKGAGGLSLRPAAPQTPPRNRRPATGGPDRLARDRAEPA